MGGLFTGFFGINSFTSSLLLLLDASLLYPVLTIFLAETDCFSKDFLSKDLF